MSTQLGVQVDEQGTLCIQLGDGPLDAGTVAQLMRAVTALTEKQVAAPCEGCGKKIYPGDGHVCPAA
jgi:hypothetical protein